MLIKTHLLAFEEDRIRMVEIDDGFKASISVTDVLEEVFKMGQNDFQPQEMPSLSVGDVVELDETCYKKYWLIMSAGWKNLTEEEYEAYKQIPIPERAISTYQRHAIK